MNSKPPAKQLGFGSLQIARERLRSKVVAPVVPVVNVAVSVLERIEINHFVVSAHGPSADFYAPITNKHFNIEFAGAFGRYFAAGMQVRNAKKYGFITAVTVNGIAL